VGVEGKILVKATATPARLRKRGELGGGKDQKGEGGVPKELRHRCLQIVKRKGILREREGSSSKKGIHLRKN